MKKILLLFSLLAILFSCDKLEPKRHIDGGIGLYFVARSCEDIVSYPILYKKSEKGTNVSIMADTTKTIDSKEFSIWIHSIDRELQDYKDRNRFPTKSETTKRYISNMDLIGRGTKVNQNKLLESQLKEDYMKHLDIKSSLRLFPIPWPYRVSGLKNFRIVALSPLFGESPETSLNKHFEIEDIYPYQIVSQKTKALMIGYLDNIKLRDISEWIYMEPLVPVSITFRMKEKPQELPARVSFVSILETTDNKILRDTVSVSLE